MLTIPAIPTTYKNVRFRSRLEARWAAFFDLCDWSWQYEPIDLNGWIPDFILGTRNPILVEVKPRLNLTEPGDAGAKMERASEGTEWGGNEKLLLGLGPFRPVGAACYGRLSLGLLAEGNYAADPGRYWWWQDALVGDYGGPDFCPAYGDYTGRMTGVHYKWPGGVVDGTEPLFLEFWNRAGNTTQWRAA